MSEAEAIAVKWCKDQKVEHHLRQMKIPFEVETVRMDQIDLEASADRQVRIGKKINDEWVLNYAIAMEQGAVFPMVILNREKKGRYTVWSGLHRLHSAQTLGTTSIEAYVVNVFDPRMMDILPRVVNTWEGQRLSKEEILLQGKYLIEQHSLDTAEVATLLSIKYETLLTYMRGQDVAIIVQQQGVNPTTIARSMLIKMAPLKRNRNVLGHVGKLIISKQLSSDECIQMIEETKQGKDELEQMAVLARWQVIASDRNRKPAVRLPVSQKVRPKFLSKLHALASFVKPYETLDQVQIVEPHDIKRVVRDFETIERQMHKILASRNGRA